MFKKPLFWIIFVLVSISAAVFSFYYFPEAYPLVTLDLKMDRQTALEQAGQLSQRHGWGPTEYEQAATFAVESDVQNFVELEGGGIDVFREILSGDLYSPYKWTVRHYREKETNETYIYFSPDGQPYGFTEHLAEDSPGDSLNADTARIIGEAAAVSEWNIDLTAYELVEQSQEIRPGGRVDHTLVYERPDVQIGEGRYRLELVVSGNRLTSLTHFIKIPEAFSRRFVEMRSANETIATVAMVGMIVFYVLGGCVVGVFFMVRQRWILWRKAVYWAVFIAFLQFLAGINQWPLAWMNYDTAVSSQGFLLQQILGLLLIFIGFSLLLAISFIAAEGLTRKAFPNHIRMWSLWSPEVAASTPVIGRTMSGYLFITLFFAFDILLYFIASRYLGWWTPSGMLFEPDILATYFPWLPPIATSLQAGFWEECMFRAIPIAGAALLGKRFGHRNLWIIGAFILQALIFGAGHANYAQQPSYARVIELIVPSIAFGLIYLYGGLLPAIIMHFAYDVVWIALPLFVSTSPGIWIDQSIVVILTLIPVWIIVRARVKTGRWMTLTDEHYNKSWQPPEKTEIVEQPVEVEIRPGLSKTTKRIIWTAGIAGLVLWVFMTDFDSRVPKLTTTRADAETVAGQILRNKSIELNDSWQTLSCVDFSNDLDDRFIWQESDEENYRLLMGTYIDPAYWSVRYVRFEGDNAERAEEYDVYLGDQGKLIGFKHVLPESRAGDSLTEDSARILALATVTEKFKLDSTAVREISAMPSKRPERIDWTFTFADTVNYKLDQGEARLSVTIAGNEITGYSQYVHIPEKWQRSYLDRQNTLGVINTTCRMLIILIFLAGAVMAIVGWTRADFSVSTFIIFFVIMFVLGVVRTLNSWPCMESTFSTAQPYTNQVLMALVLPLILIMFVTAGPALLIGFIQKWRRKQVADTGIGIIITGLALGFLMTGIVSLIAALFKPSLMPLWADFGTLGKMFPILGGAINRLSSISAGGFFMGSAILMFLFTFVDRFTAGWTKRRVLFGIITVLLFLLLAGMTIENMAYWIIFGLITGIIYLLMYIFVFRYHLALIPFMFGGMIILGEIRQIVFNAHPAVIPGSVISIILVTAAAVWWHRRLNKY